MLLPSNWILVLAALPYARNHESCFAFLCFIQILNTHTLPSYTALTHTQRFFFKGTVIAGGSNQAGWTGYSEVMSKLLKTIKQ